MSADGEITVAVKAEGVDDAAAEVSDADGDGGGSIAQAAGGGGDGGGGGLRGGLKRGGLIGGLAALVGPLLDVLEPVLAVLKAFLAPIQLAMLRIVTPALRKLLKVLPVWFRLVDQIEQLRNNVIDGLSNLLQAYVQFLTGLPGRIWRAFKAGASWLVNGATAIGGAVWSAIKSGASWIVEGATAIGTAVWKAIKAGASWVTDLVGAIADGVASLPGQIANALKSVIPSFATGGVVTGPTLASVGESGPEAIIPLDRLESMLGQDRGQQRPTQISFQGGLSAFVERVEQDPNIDL